MHVLNACFAVVRISSIYLTASGFFVVFVCFFISDWCLPTSEAYARISEENAYVLSFNAFVGI